MYTLFYAPGSASMAVHLALIETGAPYRLEKVDLQARERSADYLKLNPRGQVPTLVADGHAYFESAALLLLLAERHPEAGLAPPPGSATRPAYYQWMLFLATGLGSQFRPWFRPQDLGMDELTPPLREALLARIEAGFSQLDTHLAANGPYLLGAQLSAVDLLAIVYMRWSRNLPKPATAWPALRQFADRMRARASWKKLYEIEGLTEWAA